MNKKISQKNKKILDSKQKKQIEKEEEQKKEKIIKKKYRDMTPEEQKEYKKEYIRQYNLKKKKIFEEKQEENITRKLKGKAKKEFEKQKSGKHNVRVFSETEENIDGLSINNGMGIFYIKGIDSFNELFCLLTIKAREKGNQAVIEAIVRVHKSNGRNIAKTKRTLFEIDISDKINELNSENYNIICSKYQREILDKLQKLNIKDFCSLMMEHADDPLEMSKTLYSSIDFKYIEKNDLSLDDILMLNKIERRKRNAKKH